MTSFRDNEERSSSRVSGCRTGQGSERLLREGLADDGRLLEKGSLAGREAIQSRRDESLEGLWDVEGPIGPARPVAVALGGQEARR